MFKWLRDEGLFGWNYRYLLTHPWVIVGESYRRVRWFIQRGHRGFADCDGWSISSYLNSWLPEALRRLKSKYGTPVAMLTTTDYVGDWSDEEIPQKYWDQAHENWLQAVEDMAVGFESSRLLEEEMPEFGSARHLELAEKRDKGLALFVRYYENLWD